MPTTLLIVYRVLGTVLFALAAAAIVEKYRTVRGAVLLPARVLECRRASSTSNSRGAGGYRYLVELYANGRRLELETNDAFWFRHDKDKGKVLQVWYNPNARCVERKSWETEFLAAAMGVLATALLLILGGVILLVLGLIGEYIGRIFMCVNASPQYVERIVVKRDGAP